MNGGDNIKGQEESNLFHNIELLITYTMKNDVPSFVNVLQNLNPAEVNFYINETKYKLMFFLINLISNLQRNSKN